MSLSLILADLLRRGQCLSMTTKLIFTFRSFARSLLEQVLECIWTDVFVWRYTKQTVLISFSGQFEGKNV